MKFQTTRFGELDVDESRAIRFPLGIPGFPKAQRFVLLEYRDHIKWLQSLDNADLAFIVTDPFAFFPDYSFVVDDATERFLEVSDPASVVVLVILTVGQNEVTANLKAPIVINSSAFVGVQVLVDDDRYAFKTAFPKPKE